MAGYILKIEQGQKEMVEDLLNVVIGKFDFDKIPYAGTAKITGKAIIRVWDLPDNHPFFEEWIQFKAQADFDKTLEDAEAGNGVPVPAVKTATVEEVEAQLAPVGKTLEETLAEEEEAFGPAPDREALLTGKTEEAPAEVEEDEDDDDATWGDLEDGDGSEDEEFEAEEEDDEDWDTVYLQADTLLKKFKQEFPMKDNKTLSVDFYDVESSNVSAIGYRVTNDPIITVFYVKFKQGGTYYRYRPVAIAHANDIINEAVKKQMGRQEASVGSLFHSLLKEKADEGAISCQRFNEEKETWVVVPTKAQRKATNKQKAK